MQLVNHPDDMDDETFCLHMSKRHQDSLGGLPFIEPIPGAVAAWRAFHRRLHALRIDLEHEHAE